MNNYLAASERYDTMQYRRVGNSGLKLSALSLGLWHNFGSVDPLANQRQLLRHAFDLGITCFDLANNYGPEPGSAETNFGRLYQADFKPYRDELIITSKAGYTMWPGPYGDWGSRKYIIASCDQSLRRTQLDYFDIFYSHRFDPETPLEETALALDQLVKSGKALYIGLSNYGPEATATMTTIFKDLKTPYIINQDRYNMFSQEKAKALFPTLAETHKGAVVFSPLAQGMLTGRYLNGIPADSRAARKDSPFLNVEKVEAQLAQIKALNAIAEKRGQTLAEMALAWDLRQPVVASVIIGASRVSQLDDNVKALDHLTFTAEEEAAIDQVLA
ncbi:MAG: aldo/keto reductase [Lactobacillus sp.]|jgi:L-glyceraldehyde 3-phosphate reductase|uniref:Aldo/keto reductase n=1 Tax=Lacticaseibacillus suilingensis TaxID=2799577 RepID=A0ABW4BGJ2_9LACO|nr:aldo/keto reductase [Lacticaseibacillus suilingensis]MCI1894566.1 aldo/keto reductase [Lactobacillus sp.]MCI1917937.1 aldo/keto reductase [Lactobacillus sp.]MCI1942232.1 aldo/keto reductase [Lactobacillus sp.]MCI1972726.1 aldo/keto reductase [Lactobacillus sp.]MCI2016762.1 aldo/keto reductase [Lactobacillus sp.]